jgi:hypothetical protein
MKSLNKDLDRAAKQILKRGVVKEEKPEAPEPKEPTDAMGWLKKAYIDNDPADGAPKVGDIGYV